MDYNPDVEPRGAWPAVGTTVDAPDEQHIFTVVGYAKETGDDGVALAAALRDGDRGTPGLWRLLRDGSDAIIQYHKPNKSGRFASAPKTRMWVNAYRVDGWFSAREHATGGVEASDG